LNAYLSPEQDKPGLTRLTWNTDWAFLDKQTKINFQRLLPLPKFLAAGPQPVASLGTGFTLYSLTHTTHPLIIFIILHPCFTSNEWYYNRSN
jgi:hypothetical protein